jgi:hypothetical protein
MGFVNNPVEADIMDKPTIVGVEDYFYLMIEKCQVLQACC